MWIDVIALSVLAVFVILGLIRGTLSGVLRLTNLVVSYIASYFAAVMLADPVAERLGMNSWIGLVLVGTGAFFVCYLVLGVVFSMILRGDRARVEEEGGRSGLDRLGGGVIGGLQGGLLVILLGVMGNWLQAAQQLNAGPAAPSSAGAKLDTPRPSMVSRFTSEVIETAASVTMGDTPEAKMAANFAARPAETMENLQEFVESPQVASLQNDELFWQYVSTGAVDQALNRGSFRSISHDDNLRGRLADLGLINEQARNDPAAFRSASRDVLNQVGPKINALRNDPELQALASDPTVQAALARGDTLTLLSHPPVRAFIDKVTREAPPASN